MGSMLELYSGAPVVLMLATRCATHIKCDRKSRLDCVADYDTCDSQSHFEPI